MQAGLTLIEVLIALAISTMIAAAMATLFSTSLRSRDMVEREGQKIENGRYALEVLGDDLRLAGFYGDYMPRGATGIAWPLASAGGGNTVSWSTPEPCATALASLGWDNTAGSVNAPVHVTGYEAHPADKNAAALALPAALTACLPNYKPGTDVLALRRLSSTGYRWVETPSEKWTNLDGVDASPATGDVYLQASSCAGAADLGWPFIVDVMPAIDWKLVFKLHQLNCTSFSHLRKYISKIYYVASCDECTVPDGMPTLKVAELVYDGTLKMAARSVAPGVENLHFEYSVDAHGDGAGHGFELSNNDPLGTSPGFEWQNVMAVKAYVVVRDVEATRDHVDSREYVLGERTLKAGNDAFRRSVFAAAVRHVNPSGAREQP